MKKARRFTLVARLVTLTLVALTFLVLVGCEQVDYVTSISLKDYDPNTVIELPEEGFDYGAYTLVVSYASGKTQELPLTEDLIDGADLVKFYQAGEHEIHINYARKICLFKLAVQRSTFGNLAFPENNVFIYDGTPHIVEVEGNLPADAVVIYPAGNSFVNAGTYDVTAVVTCEGYVTEKLSTTVRIEKAAYDMSGVQFDAREFVYDGTEHKVEISGTLPEGVFPPVYTIDGVITSGATDVGEYTVRASFVSDNPNYEPIPAMETTLLITPAEHNVVGLDLVFRRVDGEVIDGNKKTYDGTDVTVELNNVSRLPKNVTVAFTIYDQDGNAISTSNVNTNIVNAGLYTVKMEFVLGDSKNYLPIDPIVREFDMLMAEYPTLEGVQLVSGQFVYDGEDHSIQIDGILPEDVTVSYEYYLNDTLVVDGEGAPVQAVKDTGRYTVKAVFTHTDPNRKEIPALTATLRITQATLDTSLLEWVVNGELVYDGKAKSLSLGTLLPEGITVAFTYYLDDQPVKAPDGTPAASVVGAGDYTVYAEFTVNNPNYTPVGIIIHTLVVEQASINIRDLAIEGSDEYVYSGNASSPSLSMDLVPESVNVLRTLYRVDDKGDRTAVESAKDCGSYVAVFTATLDDPDNYALVGSRTLEWSFKIIPQTIDVSGIGVDLTTFTYNGIDQHPLLKSIPAHVLTTTTLYSLGGTEPLTGTINAGKYRMEVALTVDSANYALSSDAKQVFAFEILPLPIDVSGVTLEGSEFVYDRTQAQSPILQNLPEHVKAATVFYALDGSEPLTETQNVGQYRCVVTLTAENGNYELSGETTLSTEYVIQKKVINLNDWFYTGVEYAYNGGDLRTHVFFIGDDPLVNYVNWDIPWGDFYVYDGETWVRTNEVIYAGRYNIPYDIQLLDSSNVILIYNDRECTSAYINHVFTIVSV